jgi:hypothetical protein
MGTYTEEILDLITVTISTLPRPLPVIILPPGEMPRCDEIISQAGEKKYTQHEIY